MHHQPRATLSWQHAMGDRDRTMVARFVGSGDFAVSGVWIRRDSLLIDGGIDLDLKRLAPNYVRAEDLLVVAIPPDCFARAQGHPGRVIRCPTK